MATEVSGLNADRERRAEGRGDGRIFVQIPAYRDPELARTLTELFSKASSPSLLRVCVLWQRHSREVLPGRLRNLSNLQIIEVPYERSKGCNWARHEIQRRWSGEPYTLVLDSHHRFVQGWDRKLVEMYKALIAKGIKRPIITAYLPPYTPRIDPLGRLRQPSKIYPFEYDAGSLLKLISYPIPNWRTLRGPIKADFLSLHFLFSRGQFNADVPFDPNMYFFGDEVAMSARAFTSGYEAFHPHIVLGWHCYDRTSRGTHWNDHSNWHLRERRSVNKLRQLLSGKWRGRYGLGAHRTLSDFASQLPVPLIWGSSR